MTPIQDDIKNKIDINALADELKPVTFEDPEKEESPKDDPKLEREYTFEITHTDRRGGMKSGRFTNKILNLGERHKMGVLRARLANGVPLSHLDELTSELNFMTAHLQLSLIEKPEWANDLFALDDITLLQKIFGEVADHEATFLGLGTDSTAGEE
jgi:hypothetical protein